MLHFACDDSVCCAPFSQSCLVSVSALSCLVLSCLVLSCLVLSFLVLSCLVVSCRVVSCRVVSCPALSCPFLFLSCLALPCLALPCLALSCGCLSVSRLVLSCGCLVLSCRVLSCLQGGNVDETFSIGHVIEICKAPPPMNFSASMKVRLGKARQPQDNRQPQDKTGQDKTTDNHKVGRSLTSIDSAWLLVACSDRPCDVSYPILLSCREETPSPMLVLFQRHKAL